MDNKILKTPYVEFLGSNASEVTGSANLIRFMNYHILVDYGLRQTSNEQEDYVCNLKRHKDIKPKKLDAIILTHCHIDHCGLIPKLYAEGATCPLYVPQGTKGLLTLMWQDSHKIFVSEHERFNRAPLYEQSAIDLALGYIVEVDLRSKQYINDHISFIYYNAQHIVKSRQVYLELNDGNNIKKLGFTGDYSTYKDRYWLNQRDDLPMVDILVGECTYSNSNRTIKERDRRTDVNKLKLAIDYALEHKSKVIIPTFSLNRLQDILAMLYETYGDKLPIRTVVDSPLGKNISAIWNKLIDKDRDLWDRICYCDDIYWIDDFKMSVALDKLQESLLVIAGGGMLSGGRATYWCKHNLSNKYNYIIFSGYNTPESPAGQIRSGKLKSVKIDGVDVRCVAHTLAFNSFSSHADHKHLLEYYTELPYNKICLVHSEQESKAKFATELKESLSKANRSSRVVITNKDSKVHF